MLFGLDDAYLDVVALAPFLGEESAKQKAWISNLSTWVFLPRLVAAPQVSMQAKRQTELANTRGWTSAVHSARQRDSIDYIGNLV